MCGREIAQSGGKLHPPRFGHWWLVRLGDNPEAAGKMRQYFGSRFSFLNFGYGRVHRALDRSRGLSGLDEWSIFFPDWFLVLLLAIFPAWRFGGWKRRRWRNRLAHGLCVTCGYDLRGSPERCPECGAPAAITTPAR